MDTLGVRLTGPTDCLDPVARSSLWGSAPGVRAGFVRNNVGHVDPRERQDLKKKRCGEMYE